MRLGMAVASPQVMGIRAALNQHATPAVEGEAYAQAQAALVALRAHLVGAGYRFTTVTPASHSRFLARERAPAASDLRDAFGWNRRFATGLLPSALLDALVRGGWIEPHGAHWRSRVRFASVGSRLYAHSAFPTEAGDAVFFGPDTYRFIDWIQRVAVPRTDAFTLVDVGCGSGAGGLEAIQLPAFASAARVVLSDVNPAALDLAQSNAASLAFSPGRAEPRVECVESDVLARVSGPIDVVVSNPPYLIDPAKRLYRDGGGENGISLALRIVRESLARLAPGGQLVLYTGTPVIGGVNVFAERVRPLLAGTWHRYHEIDPDVFGEELDLPHYSRAERIAAVGLVARVV